MRDESIRPSRAVWPTHQSVRIPAGEDDSGSVQHLVSGNGGSALRVGDPRLVRGLQSPGRRDPDTGPLPGGRWRPPRSWRPDGGVIGSVGGPTSDGVPRFDAPVPRGGYAWWYIDAVSDDGRYGLNVIAFIGSVFSPYYAWSGWRDPLDHCAMNVAIYGDGVGRWAMTERRRTALHQEKAALSIGPSSLTWQGDTLTARFDEVGAPIPSRIRGTVRLRPETLLGQSFALEASGRHAWRPIAPRAQVEVSLDHPDCHWRGQAYFDTNVGSEPLEHEFSSWDWSRAHRRSDTLICYDVQRRGGDTASLALSINSRGDVSSIQPPPRTGLPSTFWRMPRSPRSQLSEAPRLRRTLEDTPFYARSLIDGRHEGRSAQIVHETLSLDRLRSPVVRAMLPFRMPRLFW